MSQSTTKVFEIAPTVGWGEVRLGQSLEESIAATVRMGLNLQAMKHDKFMWYDPEADVSLQFIAEDPPRLACIVIDGGPMTINGCELEELRIDEALVVLGIRSYSDTMWSIMDPVDEFENGIPMSDDEQPTDKDHITLLRHGTLWIHSLGLGLGMYDGHVGQIAIREPRYTPKLGCGPLSEEMLVTVSDPQFVETVAAIRHQYSKQAGAKTAPIRWSTRLILTAIALAGFGIPAYLMYNNYSRWTNAKMVTGRIVAVDPGIFPENLTIEYSVPGEEVHAIELSVNQFSTRELEAKVELLYLPSNPRQAIALSERYDQVFAGYSPYVLVISPALAIIIISLAYPELTRSRRRDYIK